MDPLLLHFRLAVRQIRRHAGLSATMIVSLGLGIAATVTIYSIVHGVLLAPLPYPEPDRLAVVWAQTRDDATTVLSGPEVADLLAETESFEQIGRIMGAGRLAIDLGDGPEEIVSLTVSDNIFAAYGVSPALGRDFTPEDVRTVPIDVMRDPEVVRPTGAMILSHAYWQRRFGGDPGAIGRIVRFGGHPREIVGVAPAGFVMHRPPGLPQARVDAWHISYWDQTLFPRDTRFIGVVARLAPGVRPEAAQAELDAFAGRQRERYQVEKEAGLSLRLESLQDAVTAPARRPVLILFGAVVLVLLVTCANVAHLSLTQALGRHREWTLRASLGASPARLLSQSLIESHVIALLGGVLGLGLAGLALPVLLRLRPDALPRVSEVRFDGAAVVFAVVLAAMSTLLFGFVPALRNARVEATDAMLGRRATARDGLRMQAGLVIGEVALALVLVIGAGLLVRSLHALHQVDPGFEPEGVVTVRMTPQPRALATPESRLAFFRELQEEVAALPGVEAAGLGAPLPFQGESGLTVTVDDAEGVPREHNVRAMRVLPGALEALGVRRVGGRLPSWDDFNDPDRLVAVVDRRFDEHVLPGRSAVGETLRLSRREYRGSDEVFDAEYEVEIVGVVADVRGESLAAEDRPSIYVSWHQNPWGTATLAVKSAAAPEALLPVLRETLRGHAVQATSSAPSLLADDVDATLAPLRFSLQLIGVFGVLSVVLAWVGIYGVLAYSVRRRHHEIGIRMALGARAGVIVRWVLGSGLKLTLAGLVLGGAAAAGLTRLLGSQLYGVSASDVPTYLTVGATLLLVAAVACYLPARLASRVDPVEALRQD